MPREGGGEGPAAVRPPPPPPPLTTLHSPNDAMFLTASMEPARSMGPTKSHEGGDIKCRRWTVPFRSSWPHRTLHDKYWDSVVASAAPNTPIWKPGQGGARRAKPISKGQCISGYMQFFCWVLHVLVVMAMSGAHVNQTTATMPQDDPDDTAMAFSWGLSSGFARKESEW